MLAREQAAAAAASVVIAPPEPLALETLGRIAAGAPVALGAGVHERLVASHRQMLGLSRADRIVYGLNTGCGPLCEWPVPPEDAARFQQNLVRSHAAGLGPMHPRAVVRATMAARLLSLAQGRSAVRPLVADTLAAMLNAGVHPVLHEVGSVGASGDLVELAHVALAVMGEGRVEHAGELLPAAEALADVGILPVSFEGREALALLNGTSCETAQAALLVLGTEELVAAAEAAAALAIEALGGSIEAFDPRVHAVRPHAGQAASARHLAALLAGSRRVREGARGDGAGNGRLAPVQDAYTLRCVPQVLGAVHFLARENDLGVTVCRFEHDVIRDSAIVGNARVLGGKDDAVYEDELGVVHRAREAAQVDPRCHDSSVATAGGPSAHRTAHMRPAPPGFKPTYP